ncbi:MAG: YciI family protein [Solirubrobacteraceae bacterium]
MKYLILIYSNPSSREIWDRMSSDERAQGLSAYTALNEELAQTGELIATEALADPALTTRVSTTSGQVVTTDGPFAEAKELLLGGFYLIECDASERAVAIAASLPEAALGLIEVRPVMSLTGFDL